MRTLPVLAAALLSTTALAQVRQPAQITTLPTTTPQEFDLLDKNGNWLPFGTMAGGGWRGAGAAIDVDQFPTVKGDFVNDDGPAIVAAIAAAAVKGGTVALKAHPYWNQTQAIVIPKNVRLSCAGGFTKFDLNYDHTQLPCTIYQKAGTTLTVYGELSDAGLLQDQVHFLPKATRANIVAFVNQFAGTGVQIGPADATEAGSQAVVQNVLIGGFGTCINANGAYQMQIRQVLGDCTDGLKIDGSFDNNALADIEFWQFLVTHKPGIGANSWTIAALADNGSGLWRVTTSAANDIVTGEKIWVAPNGTGGIGAGGQWTVTQIDPTHFDLQGSNVAPTTIGDTLINQTYVGNLGSVSNLQPGMTVTGTNIPAGATIAAVWRTRNAISLDSTHAATATATGIALSFANVAYSGAPGAAFYDGLWRSGTGFAFGKADGTKCSSCFAFAYQTGFSFTNSTGVSVSAADSDQFVAIGGRTTPHLCNQNTVPVGIRIAGTTFDSQISGKVLTNDCVSVMNVGTSVNPGFTVKDFRPGSVAAIATKLENAGPLQLNMTGFQAGGGGSILLDTAAQTPVLSNNTLAGVKIYTTTGAAFPWVGAGNTFSGSVGASLPTMTGPTRISGQGPGINQSALFISAGDGVAEGGQIALTNTNPGAVTPNKYFRVHNSGALQFLDSAYTTVLLGSDDLGNVTAATSVSAPVFKSGAAVGFSGTKTAGTCVLTISGGIITNVTGC